MPKPVTNMAERMALVKENICPTRGADLAIRKYSDVIPSLAKGEEDSLVKACQRCVFWTCYSE